MGRLTNPPSDLMPAIKAIGVSPDTLSRELNLLEATPAVIGSEEGECCALRIGPVWHLLTIHVGVVTRGKGRLPKRLRY